MQKNDAVIAVFDDHQSAETRLLVMAHGSVEKMDRAKDILGTLSPQQLDHHLAT